MHAKLSFLSVSYKMHLDLPRSTQIYSDLTVNPVFPFKIGQRHGFTLLVRAGTKDGVINHDSGNWRDKHTSLTDTVLMMPPQAPGGLRNTSITTYNFTTREKHIQQILAVTLSSTGILYAIVTLYWFARMKKAFRHQYVTFATRC